MLEELISILEKSVKLHGEKPLTNAWLLNVMKLTQKMVEYEELQDDRPDAV